MENRLQDYDADPGAGFTKDKKEMKGDTYSKWRVYNTLKFRNKISLLKKKKIISEVEVTHTFFAMSKVKNSLVAKAYVYKILR